MNIQLNGSPREVDAATLAEALKEWGYETAAVATAVNGTFVPRAARVETALQEGDEVEVLAPRQGG